MPARLPRRNFTSHEVEHSRKSARSRLQALGALPGHLIGVSTPPEPRNTWNGTFAEIRAWLPPGARDDSRTPYRRIYPAETSQHMGRDNRGNPREAASMTPRRIPQTSRRRICSAGTSPYVEWDGRGIALPLQGAAMVLCSVHFRGLRRLHTPSTRPTDRVTVGPETRRTSRALHSPTPAICHIGASHTPKPWSTDHSPTEHPTRPSSNI